MATRNGTVSLDTEVDLALDSSVPIWSARRNADLLGDALGRKVDIT